MSIGTTRNLTPQFRKLREEARKRIPEQNRKAAKLLDAALADPENGAGTSSGGPTPDWIYKSEKVKAEMGILKDRIQKLKEYHSKSLLVSFDSENDNKQHVEALTTEVQRTFRRLDKEIRGVMDNTASEDDRQVRLQVQRQLAQALFKLSTDFRKEETRFLNKVEKQQGMDPGSLGFVEEEIAAGEAAVRDPGLTEAQIAVVNQMDSLIDERSQDIHRILTTITELATIMKDLSTMVVEQGTKLDRIDHNIEMTAIKVEQGVKELEQAEKHQKNQGMMLCIMGLVVFIVIMFIVVIIRHVKL